MLCCSLYIVCWLCFFGVRCSVFVVGGSLLFVGCPLFVVRCSLCRMSCVFFLCRVSCLLFVGVCWWFVILEFVVCCLLFVGRLVVWLLVVG